MLLLDNQRITSSSVNQHFNCKILTIIFVWYNKKKTKIKYISVIIDKIVMLTVTIMYTDDALVYIQFTDFKKYIY